MDREEEKRKRTSGCCMCFKAREGEGRYKIGGKGGRKERKKEKLTVKWKDEDLRKQAGDRKTWMKGWDE